jgi:hypothetical protein
MDRLAEFVVEREAMVDQVSIAIRHQRAGARLGDRVRPGQDAVPPPDLHRGDVALTEDALGELSVSLPRNVDATVADKQGVLDTVDVAGEGGRLGVESLALQGAREDRPERDARTGADQRRRQEEDTKERERPLEGAPAPQPLAVLHRRNIGGQARWD